MCCSLYIISMSILNTEYDNYVCFWCCTRPAVIGVSGYFSFYCARDRHAGKNGADGQHPDPQPDLEWRWPCGIHVPYARQTFTKHAVGQRDFRSSHPVHSRGWRGGGGQGDVVKPLTDRCLSAHRTLQLWRQQQRWQRSPRPSLPLC